ncbi:MAG: alpha/beta hydrolase [Pseudomonadota bacterium]
MFLTTPDNTRIRIAIWAGGTRGTVIVMPGRTEYIEKYGAVVSELCARDLSVVVIDWRGQGLSARPIAGRSIGFVRDFAEYQQDLATVLAAPEVARLPTPRVLLAHSMGGCIALRALTEGLDVAGALFSAPMWGIELPKPTGPVKGVIHAASQLGLGQSYASGTGQTTYVLTTTFEKNTLTTDAAVFERLVAEARAAPELTLGGPSYGWIAAALREFRALNRAAPPKTPILCFLGTAECVVEPGAIRRQTARQPKAALITLAGARHEILMEDAPIRARAWAEIDGFLATHLPKAG